MNLYQLHVDAISREPLLANSTFDFSFFSDIKPIDIIPEGEMTQKLLVELFRKNPFIDIGVNKGDIAKSVFFEGERRCASYNEQFSKLMANPTLKRIMQVHRRMVISLMGRPIKQSAFTACTSGATDNLGRGNNPAERFLEANITPELHSWFHMYGPPTPFVLWDWKTISITDGNVALCVPKSLKTDRLVCPEPAANAAVQREIGLQLSRRLSDWGIPISSGKQRHMRLALEGSVGNHLTTDDQSNASGHIYTEFVRNSVSNKWFELLNSSRSHKTQFDTTPVSPWKSWWRNEGFMSQGNGFCFELETILFLCLIRATAKVLHNEDLSCLDVTVFGDDAIYPSHLTLSVRKVFKAFGFIINEEKSFSDHQFRESCGGDYFSGHNVRGLYFKNLGLSNFEKTIRANQLFDWLEEHNEHEYRFIRKYRADLIRCIDARDRLWGPPSLGDAVLKTNKPHLWNVKYLGKQRHARIRTWSQSQKDFTSLGALIHRGLKPNQMMALASLGYLSNCGYVWLKNRKSKSDEQVYNLFPAAGSQLSIGKRTSFFSEFSNPVDSEHPLSVFEPGLVNMPNWMYNPSAYEARRVSLRRDLLKMIVGLLDKKGVFDTFSIDTSFDF